MNVDKAIQLIEKDQFKKDLPVFKTGDEVRVAQRIQEGDKSRIQNFEGTVIGRKGRGLSATFIVLRQDRNNSVEKVFPLHGPLVEKITVLRSSGKKIKKAKMYYLRHK